MDTFWTILDILSQTMIGKEEKIGKYTTKSIMVEIDESNISNNNIKVQRVHECIKYERDKLIEIVLKCKHDNCYKIINKDTCVKIREYRLNRRCRRGGKRFKTIFRKLVQHNTLNISNLINISCNDRFSNNNRDTIQIALINAQSLRSKELLLYGL